MELQAVSDDFATVRDALATLSFASDGHFEDEAADALDALDRIENHHPASKGRPIPSAEPGEELGRDEG